MPPMQNFSMQNFSMPNSIRSRLGIVGAALALGCMAPVAASQGYGQTVPMALQARDGANVESDLLSGNAGRLQVLIAARTLRGFDKKVIRRLIIRRDAQTAALFPQGMKGGWIDLHILASWTSRDVRNPSTRFAANHGPTVRTVYSGAYHVPDSRRLAPGSKVASLAPDVSAHIVLRSPIPYKPNRNLCLEFVHKPHVSKSAPPRWLADLDVRSGGSATTFGRSCFRAQHVDAQANQFSDSAPIGGSLFCLTSAPVTPMALLALGASRTRWGNNRLPYDFGNMGAKNCYLFVSLDLLFATSAKAQPGYPRPRASAEVQLPFDAGLVGSRLFSEWFFYQPGANALSMTTTNGASVRITASPGLDSVLVQSHDPYSASGRTYPGRALALHLQER